jgi:hypothetical protein
LTASGYPLGIDVGLDKFLATSEGELIERPKFLSRLQSELKLIGFIIALVPNNYCVNRIPSI